MMYSQESKHEIQNMNELLWKAFGDSDIKLVRQLINDGADVNSRDPASSDTLLVASTNNFSGEGDLEIVRILLENGADTNMRTGAGFTPLVNAIARGLIEIVKLLLDHGADVNGNSGMLGWTPLMEAVKHEQTLIFKYLISRGANPRAKNHDREDLYSWASGTDLNPYFY